MEPTTPIKYVERAIHSHLNVICNGYARASLSIILLRNSTHYTLHRLHFKLIFYFLFHFATLWKTQKERTQLLLLKLVHNKIHMQSTHLSGDDGGCKIASLGYVSVRNNKLFRGMCTQLM